MDLTRFINGCDSFPDGNWRHCCDVHDIAYTVGGEWWQRLQADWVLAVCVNSSLPGLGFVMLAGVLGAGWLFYRYRSLGGRNIAEIITERRASVPATARIRRYIGAHEGRVLRAYRDPAHVITIGYGFTWRSEVFRVWWAANRGTKKLAMGDTMTEAEALEVLGLLLNNEYLPPVEKKFGAQKINVREGGLDTCYNAGPGSLQWRWANAIAAGDVRGGADLLRTTAVTGGGKRLPGLVRRRNETADIIAFDRWPAWMGAVESATDYSPPQKIETHVDQLDIAQAQRWLEELGYAPGPADGIVGARTINATRRFQQAHGKLKVDGIIGPATLSALQRAIDYRKKAGQAAGGGGAAAGAGAAENNTGVGDAVDSPVGTGDLGWLGDLLLWGGLAFVVVAIVWLSWRYRDELSATLRRLF